jgi:hypothetical protein|tara:strand:+ start:1331 stop:3238 length:1908 start_codon:yes stop_codon:yes gene_type:complete
MSVLPSPSNTSEPQSLGFEANLDDLFLRFAVGPGRQMNINTAPLQAQAIQTSETPEDFQQEFGQIYSRTDFSGGSGLDKAHKRNAGENDFAKFWDSSGIDVFSDKAVGQEYKVSLLHATEEVLTSSETNLYMQELSGVIYYADGAVLKKIATPLTSAVTTDGTPSGGNDITGMAVLGTKLYLVANGAIYVRNSAGSFSSYNADNTYDKIWSIKGRIVASSTAGVLYDVSGGTDSVMKTLPSGSTWTDMCDAGAVAMATADDGYIYSFADESSTLTIKGQSYVEGEVPNAIDAAQGFVFYGTATNTASGKIGRLYRAEVTNANNLYVLVNNQLIKQWGDGTTTLDQAPYKIVSTRDSIYTGIKDTASKTNLWRYYLPTGGIARDLEFSEGGIVEGISVFSDNIFATVSGGGIYRETTNYVLSGYIITALGDFFTSEKKQWVGAKLNTNSVSTGEVKLSTSIIPTDINNTSANTWEEQISINSGIGGDEEVMSLVSGRWIAGKIDITTDDPTKSPGFLSFAIRGFQLVNDLVVDIPVNISDQIERPFRKRLKVNGQGELVYQALRNKEGKNVQLEIYRPDTLLRGIIENVSSPIEEVSSRGSVTTYCLVRFRGSKVIQVSTAGQGLGIGLLGTGRLG